MSTEGVQVFPIPPATGKGAWILVAVALLLIATVAMLGWVAWSTKHSRVEVSEEGVRLVGDLWGRTIPLARLDLERGRVVDLRAEPDLAPARRTMGTGLGSFASGWFRLRNGEKALLYLTDRRSVVYVPTHDGYALLLSSSEPERLLAALRGG